MPTLHPVWTHSANAAYYVVNSGQTVETYSQSNNVGYVNSAVISVPDLGTWYWSVTSYYANGTEGGASQQVAESATPDPVQAPTGAVLLSLVS